MNWHASYLDRLADNPCCGYQAGGAAAAEPTALAALTLVGWERSDAARVAADWLVDLQADDGSVGVRAGEPTPCWPTGLSVLAWLAAGEDGNRYRAAVDRALAWMLTIRSKTSPRGGVMQHDTSLVAWPWVDGTHAWVEPTAFNVLALKASGNGHLPRAREAVRVLLDRQLPAGGCNYGNTRVLGRQLRPHLLPTGLAALALHGEDASDPRLAKSLSFLANHVSAEVPVLSLCWALLGLARHGKSPVDGHDWLAQIAKRMQGDCRPRIQTVLLLLSALGDNAPLTELNESPRRVLPAT